MTKKGIVMKQRFILFRRAGVFYYEDTSTGQQLSLRTKDEAEARILLNAKNESFRQPVLNRQIARTYLAATDSAMATRIWQVPMDEMTKTKTGATRTRHQCAMRDKAFDLIRNLPILETHSAHFLKVLELGKVSTNVYLRRIHNFALDMNWLPWPILPKKQWPQVRFKEKRAITFEEHQKIIAAEVNPEREMLYQLCWHLGASQGDIANLKGEDVDWENSTVSFIRKKTGVPVLVHLGAEALNLFKDLPAEGMLFPYLSRVRANDRATEFRSRCRQLAISGVTLHSYRYAWAERAKTVGYPERFAQEALGHNSKAVHRAYAKRALMKIPSLEDYEQRTAVLSTGAKQGGRERGISGHN
jgi:integrase